jgi:hypothetical protein
MDDNARIIHIPTCEIEAGPVMVKMYFCTEVHCMSRECKYSIGGGAVVGCVCWYLIMDPPPRSPESTEHTGSRDCDYGTTAVSALCDEKQGSLPPIQYVVKKPPTSKVK